MYIYNQNGWDYKARTLSEKHPFEHVEDTTYALPPNMRQLAFKPYQPYPDLALPKATLGYGRSNFPTESFSLSSEDVHLAGKGRDPLKVATGYRLIEKAGAKEYRNVKCHHEPEALHETTLGKMAIEECEEKERQWHQKAVDQHKDPEEENVTTKIFRQKSIFPRLDPPHPLWKTSNAIYGTRTDFKHYVFKPRGQNFSKTFKNSGMYRKQGLSTHLDISRVNRADALGWK